jgi:SAM-dependent methyltransferase
MSLGVCECCGFVFNQSFEPEQVNYGANYDNTQTCSPSFDEYLGELARHLICKKNVRNCRIVEVGCGKGQFLRRLVEGVEAENSGNTGYGFDPSYVGPLSDLDGRLRFEKRYYDTGCTDTAADVVICRHVIEHVANSLDLLSIIHRTLNSTLRARVFIETPCTEWILRNQVICDFFYEHCSYFTSRSLTTALEIAGFRVEEVCHVFGGQYLWLEAAVAQRPTSGPANPRADAIPALAREFGVAEAQLIKDWKARIENLHVEAGGKTAIWGGVQKAQHSPIW